MKILTIRRNAFIVAWAAVGTVLAAYLWAAGVRHLASHDSPQRIIA